MTAGRPRRGWVVRPALARSAARGVRGGELSGSERGLNEAITGPPSAGGGRKNREEAEETSGVS